ncbi:unnamed protein product [Durusdinium trenchii]|uniref:Uncharacterized protein n=1 Tax=Durusdinium trenchii TaxID=1381693 RepID=A0ABP0J0Z7_9DINO
MQAMAFDGDMVLWKTPGLYATPTAPDPLPVRSALAALLRSSNVPRHATPAPQPLTELAEADAAVSLRPASRGTIEQFLLRASQGPAGSEPDRCRTGRGGWRVRGRGGV